MEPIFRTMVISMMVDVIRMEMPWSVCNMYNERVRHNENGGAHVMVTVIIPHSAFP